MARSKGDRRMIVFLFKSILGIILFTCLMIVNVGCLWVLKIMLDELITDEFIKKARKLYGNAVERLPSRIKEIGKRLDSVPDSDSESISEWRD